MTKAEMIQKYGIEYYEEFKTRAKKYQRDRYWKNPERERERCRKKYANNPEFAKQYNKLHREIFRINSRDRNRLRILRGMNLDGKEVHHLKYHSDNKDASWIDDIQILTPEEHRAWHNSHPEFKAEDNVV